MKIKKHTITHAIKYIFLSLLLALPFIAMLPSTFYYAFNQNAQDNTANEVNITYQYKTNEVNTFNDLIIGNMYKFKKYNYINFAKTIDWYMQDNNIQEIVFNTYNQSIIVGDYYPTFDDYYTSAGILENNTFFVKNEGELYQYIHILVGYYGQDTLYTTLMYYDIEQGIEECDFILTQDIKDAIEFLLIDYDLIDYDTPNEVLKEIIKPSTYLGTENIEVIEHDLNNQNAFYYASSQVFNKPLFNWVKNSIFVVPIMGMLGIFGISEMNFISSLLVYWVNILSIYAILNIILLVIEKLGSFGKRKNE